MPEAGATRAPISDCVQNQSARTIPVTSSRRSNRRLRLVLSVSVIEGYSSSARSSLFLGCSLRHLHRQPARFPQIELSSPEIGKVLDAQELILARPPQRRKVALP